MANFATTCIFVLIALITRSNAFGNFNLASLLSPGRRKQAEKMSEDMNNFIKGGNELAGEEVITPLEKREGLGRMFFTVTPTPSVSPTPSQTPSPSITPTPSVSPSVSATPSYSPSPTTTPSASKTTTPTPTPTKSPKKQSTSNNNNNNNNNSNPTPTPTPSSSPAAGTVTRSTGAVTVPTDGTPVTVSVDFTGTSVSDQSTATITSIQASGDLPVGTGRQLLLGTDRQTTVSAFLEVLLADGSSTQAVVQNSCDEGLGPATFTSVGVSVSSEGGSVSLVVSIRAFNFGGACSVTVEIEVSAEESTDDTDDAGSTPIPIPSN